MNVESKPLKLDWKKIAVIAIVLGIAGYKWYTESGSTNASLGSGPSATDSTSGEVVNLPVGERVGNEKTPEAYLKSVGGKNLKSPAGLIYTGSRSEHRADHVLRHAQDIPDRPGPHGVFHANDDDVFRLIDEAYELVKIRSGQVKTKPSDDDRTEYIIDMKREIGFKGGQEGQRKHHPKLFKIKLVLSENRVITAYPY